MQRVPKSQALSYTDTSSKQLNNTANVKSILSNKQRTSSYGPNNHEVFSRDSDVSAERRVGFMD